MKNEIEIENKGGSFPDSKVTSFESSPFVWQDEEKPGWMHSQHLAGGMEFNVFTAAPNAVFEGHKAPGDWIGYAVRGSGKLTLTDDNGIVQKEIAFTQGDVFVFRTDTMHGWKIGPEGAQTVFVCRT